MDFFQHWSTDVLFAFADSGSATPLVCHWAAELFHSEPHHISGTAAFRYGVVP